MSGTACCRLAAKGKGKDKVKAAKAEPSVPFKAASPMKQAPAAQAGTYYGTIGGKIPYVPVCFPCMQGCYTAKADCATHLRIAHHLLDIVSSKHFVHSSLLIRLPVDLHAATIQLLAQILLVITTG